MAGALIVLLADGRPVRSVFTNERGEFSIDAPDAGALELRVAQQGFRAEPLRLSASAEARNLGTLRVTVSAIVEAVIVSASQVELPLSEAPSTVSVITGRELEAKQVQSVADALRTIPGLTVASAGGAGAQTGVFPRGGESNFTLVFVDDVPVNAFGGEFDFAHLPTVNIDRIEVVRGPQSALFGSNAIGAVVRIVTRRGGAPAVSGSVEVGGYNTQRFTAGTSGSRGAFEWGASAERLTSDGYNDQRTDAGLLVSNDDYERTSATVTGGWRGKAAMLRAQLQFGTDDRGAPGPFGTNPVGNYFGIDTTSRNANDTTVASVMGSFPINDRVRAVVLTAFHRMESDFISPFAPSEASSRRWASRGQLDYTPRRGLALSAGVELQRERAGSTYITGASGQMIPIARTVAGYFTEARVNAAERIHLTAGLRMEHIRRDRIEPSPDPFLPRPELPSDSVVSFNPKVSVAWFARPKTDNFTKLRASIGTGIRPPSGFDLAFTDNPSLKPERTFSTEAGIEQAFAGGEARVDAVAFFNNYDDLIVAVGSFAEASRYQTDNISNARSRGIEIGLTRRHRWGADRPLDLQARIAYTFLDTEILAVDQSGEAPPPFTVGTALLRQPKHQFSADVTAARGAWSGFISGGGRTRTLDVEPSFGPSGGLFNAPGFQVWNAGAAWKLRRAEIFGRLENLFDRQYEEAFGFPSLGRRATVGLRLAEGG